MEREDVDTLIKECCDEEDADGFVPYERKLHFFFLGIMLHKLILVTLILNQKQCIVVFYSTYFLYLIKYCSVY